MFFSLNQIIAIIAHYKYLVLFPIVVVEGPIATVVTGILIYNGFLNFFIAYPVIIFADVAGDCIHYAIGRWGREKFINKWGHKFGITVDKVEKAEHLFKNHGGKTLVLGKISHGIGGVALVAAGMAKMNFGKYVWYNTLATIVKSLLLIMVGYYFGSALERVNSYLGIAAAVFSGLFIALLIIWVLYHHHKKEAYE